MKHYDVIALGELLIDFACTQTDADGYPVMAAHPGGAPANFLAALTRFGAKTAMISKVGTDAFGALLTGTLEKADDQTLPGEAVRICLRMRSLRACGAACASRAQIGRRPFGVTKTASFGRGWTNALRAYIFLFFDAFSLVDLSSKQYNTRR